MKSVLVRVISHHAIALTLGSGLLLSTGVRANTIPDAWITTQVRTNLLTTEGFSSGAIHIDTVDGRVTLYGTVGSAEQSVTAESIARRVEGTMDVRNLLQVRTPAERTVGKSIDKVIEHNVDKALKADSALTDSTITVKSVDAGVVLLTGTTASLSDHVRALEDAGRVDSVRRVASEIKSPSRLGDAEIFRDGVYDTTVAERSAASDMWATSAIKLRLLASSDAPGFPINVDTVGGVVTLFGVADTNAEKVAAEREARKVDGTRSVHNEIQVVAPAAQKQGARNDAVIVEGVQQRLAGNSLLSNCRFHVEVKNGVVRMGGGVKSQLDRLVALTVVRTTPGVRGLVDELTIQPAAGGAPSAIPMR